MGRKKSRKSEALRAVKGKGEAEIHMPNHGKRRRKERNGLLAAPAVENDVQRGGREEKGGGGESNLENIYSSEAS